MTFTRLHLVARALSCRHLVAGTVGQQEELKARLMTNPLSCDDKYTVASTIWQRMSGRKVSSKFTG